MFVTPPTFIKPAPKTTSLSPAAAVKETASTTVSKFFTFLNKKDCMKGQEVVFKNGRLGPYKAGTVSYGFTRTGKLDHILKIADRVQDIAEHGIQKVLKSGDIDGDTLDLDQIQINLDAMEKQLLDKVSSLRPSPGFLEKVKGIFTNDSDVSESFDEIEPKPVSDDEERYYETKAKVENHFAVAKSKIQSFRDPIAVQTLRKALDVANKTISIFTYFNKNNVIISKLKGLLNKANEQLEIDPENQIFKKQKDEIELILVGADTGLHALKEAYSVILRDLKRPGKKDSPTKTFYSSNPSYEAIKLIYNIEENESRKNSLYNLLAVIKMINKIQPSIEENNNSDDPVLENKELKTNSKISFGMKALKLGAVVAFEKGPHSLEDLLGITTTAASAALPYGLSYAPTIGKYALYAAFIDPMRFYKTVKGVFTAGINTVSSIKNLMNSMTETNQTNNKKPKTDKRGPIINKKTAFSLFTETHPLN